MYIFFISRILKCVSICQKYGMETRCVIDFQGTAHICRNSPCYFADFVKLLVLMCWEIDVMIPFTCPDSYDLSLYICCWSLQETGFLYWFTSVHQYNCSYVNFQISPHFQLVISTVPFNAGFYHVSGHEFKSLF